VNAPGGRGIEASEQTVQRTGPAPLALRQAQSKGLIPSRQRRQSFEERAQVKPRTADDNRKMPTPGDFGDRFARGAGVLAGRVNLRRLQHVDHVLANSAGLVWRNLGGADVESAIELKRVAVDDLSLKFGGNPQSERAFSRAGWADNCNQERV
jgi:hypothetical protein